MRNRTQSLGLLVFTLLLPPTVTAVTVQETPFEITGFMDVQFTTDEATAGERDFRLGQAELDFFACTSDHSCACVAIAYDPSSGTFGLGAATIEFLVAGNGSDCRHHYEKWERSGLVVGQFDVPFGIDWLVCPSVDRPTITAPDAIGATHAGWNELGASVFIEAKQYTLRAWFVNGFDAELVTAEDHVHLATESAVGARASALPAPGLELGLSAAAFSTPADDQSMSLLGLDAQATRGPWSLRAELVEHRLDFGAPGDFTNRGWYAQGMRDFGGGHLYARYDDVDFQSVDRGIALRSGAEDVKSIVIGAGVCVSPPAEFRIQFRTARGTSAAGWSAQFVAAF